MRDIGAPHAPQKRREGFFIYWDIRVQERYGGLPPVSSAGIANYLYDQKPHRPRALTTGMVISDSERIHTERRGSAWARRKPGDYAKVLPANIYICMSRTDAPVVPLGAAACPGLRKNVP